ncbi:MAG: hypothetical protein F4X22_12130 [Gemmatimonadales bacterium]|nr:hypothetical protein [Gemmatimonadales bacterium]MYC88965.1 hypothetical protein [Candidatus Palauibacter denitrificans]
MRHGTLKVLLPVAITMALPAAAVGQEREAAQVMTEREAATVLLNDRDSPDVWHAIGLAVELGSRAGRELRTAVIEAGWAEVRREADARAGLGPVGETDVDLLFMLFEAAEALRDPQAIPLMIEALKNGGGVYDGLADLGAAAFPAVLAAVNDPGGHPYRVSGGLTVLRFMIEDGSLNAPGLEQVREATRERLSGTQGLLVVNAAVRLALALGDPELRRTVERLATDRAFVAALVPPYWDNGTPRKPEHLDWRLDSVQENARLFLSGGGADIGPNRRRTPPR